MPIAPPAARPLGALRQSPVAAAAPAVTDPMRLLSRVGAGAAVSVNHRHAKRGNLRISGDHCFGGDIESGQRDRRWSTRPSCGAGQLAGLEIMQASKRHAARSSGSGVWARKRAGDRRGGMASTGLPAIWCSRRSPAYRPQACPRASRDRRSSQTVSKGTIGSPRRFSTMVSCAGWKSPLHPHRAAVDLQRSTGAAPSCAALHPLAGDPVPRRSGTSRLAWMSPWHALSPLVKVRRLQGGSPDRLVHR